MPLATTGCVQRPPSRRDSLLFSGISNRPFSFHPFGDASALGSLAGSHLNARIQAMAATANGQGYWLVAADGGVFSFGGAPFLGGLSGQHLNQPVRGLVSSG